MIGPEYVTLVQETEDGKGRDQERGGGLLAPGSRVKIARYVGFDVGTCQPRRYRAG